ncbi:hypothetical protein [Fibrella forsythiae]|uniref:Uncharacterized protein n=1 Tax=Fibrella forsythiae TaxID=2817061 RepID=A0ABS3JAE3_9BACT|nr:hypothetical protein [Fibrella forsythiae]MBO0946969.1 hypothetical protein [Fibrella forsythiae]
MVSRPNTKTSPCLAQLIVQLQNVQLLSEQITPGQYALHRSIEELTLRLADCIYQLDDQILEAIGMPG